MTGTDGLFAVAVTEVWVTATTDLFLWPAVVVGKTAILPANIARFFRRGTGEYKAIRRLAGRPSQGAVEWVGQTAVAG